MDSMGTAVAITLSIVGFAAVPFGFVEDRELRARAAGFFALGHCMVWEMLNASLDPRDLPDWANGWMVAAICVFSWFFFYPDADLAHPVGSQASLRSRYERGIRLTARQEERHRLARDLHDSRSQNYCSPLSAPWRWGVRISTHG